MNEKVTNNKNRAADSEFLLLIRLLIIFPGDPLYWDYVKEQQQILTLTE